jgi:hypothetical protein
MQMMAGRKVLQVWAVPLVVSCRRQEFVEFLRNFQKRLRLVAFERVTRNVSPLDYDVFVAVCRVQTLQDHDRCLELSIAAMRRKRKVLVYKNALIPFYLPLFKAVCDGAEHDEKRRIKDGKL